ncbi:hypothetical protein DRJ16_04850 [Candidatus Woesearchaeota archaeon]|nr:MAG: hypothetical protein DRJ16_04850 [Candidatus Woesearchaeota archaeon]
MPRIIVENWSKIGGGLGGTLRELREKARKEKEWGERFYGVKGLRCYAVGVKFADRRRPKWFKNVLIAKNKEEAKRILRQYNFSLDMIVLKRLDNATNAKSKKKGSSKKRGGGVLKASKRQTGKSKSVERDKKLKALPPGKRRSRSGKIYYEYRQNRSDLRDGV